MKMLNAMKEKRFEGKVEENTTHDELKLTSLIRLPRLNN